MKRNLAIAAAILAIAATAYAGGTIDSIVRGSSPSGAGDVLCGTAAGLAAFESPATCGISGGGATTSYWADAGSVDGGNQGTITATAKSLTVQIYGDGGQLPIVPLVHMPAGQSLRSKYCMEADNAQMLGGVGSTVYFDPQFTAVPTCTCADYSTAGLVQCKPTPLPDGGSTMQLNGPNTDYLNWICIGPCDSP